MKRRLSLLLALVLAFGIFAVPVQAASQGGIAPMAAGDNIFYEEDDDSNVNYDRNNTKEKADYIYDDYTVYGFLRRVDFDYYRFYVSQRSKVSFELYATQRCVGANIWTPGGTLIQSAPSGFLVEGLYRYQQTVTLDPGTYYLRVMNDENYYTYTADYVFYFTIDPIKTHTHSYTSKVVSPTCTAAGYTLKTCSCGDSYKTNSVAAKGHKITNTLQLNGTKGQVKQKCSQCSASLGTKVATGWVLHNSKYYYFNSSGVMQTGWQKVGKTWYYMNSSGVMQTGWEKVGGVWYYMNSSGAMLTGWQRISGVWYYFNSSGAMQTGWQRIGGVWYYFNSSGAMQTGWQKIGGVWYYFNSSGRMATGTVTISGKRYVFASSGKWLR